MKSRRLKETSPAQDVGAAFPEIKTRFDRRRSGKDQLICKQGVYTGCSVLKLQKASWTNDRMDDVRNETGIFFSVWVDAEVQRTNKAHYNIHALKLRKLDGYSITSRDFADHFRNAFGAMRGAWPNVSLKYGPLTLMQGWIEIDASRFEDDVLHLMTQFERLCPVIDRLLAARRRIARA